MLKQILGTALVLTLFFGMTAGTVLSLEYYVKWAAIYKAKLK